MTTGRAVRPLARAATLPVAAALALSACASTAGDTTATTPAASTTPTPSQTPTPSPTAVTASPFGTITEFKDALVTAGYPCPEWTESNHVTGAAQSGSCSDDDVLATFTSESDRDTMVDFLKAMGDASLLVGPNWIHNSPYVESIQPLMGGSLVTN